MTDARREEPRSEVYRRQSEEARRQIATWPAWMQANLRPTTSPTPTRPEHPAGPRSDIYRRQTEEARREMAAWPSWLDPRRPDGGR